MTREYVRVVCNIWCKWEGLPPIYRVYVNDELFSERTWIWPEDIFLHENLQIEAAPGEYDIRYELVTPNLAELYVTPPTVDYGPGKIISNGQLRIENAPA